MQVIFIIALIIGAIFITRAFGAWMLRIDEVIDLQKQIGKELQGIREDLKKNEPKQEYK